MGIENSQLRPQDIEVDDKEKEVCDYWTHRNGTLFDSDNVTAVSVFIGDSSSTQISFWDRENPLQKNAKNLMVYRHPSIIKYISFWKKSSKFYLAVEELTPLRNVLTVLTDLQISVGLYSILKALRFLHETASASHNNVCISSVYISKDGEWKLGGMEYLCKYIELGEDYLQKSRKFRYSKAIDGDEKKLLKSNRKELIDVYAFGVFVKEILQIKHTDDPSLSDFHMYCEQNLLNPELAERPSFGTILNHPFFDQDFIKIHSFLTELPLKPDIEKTSFFKTLPDKLRAFDENLVAIQLSGLLLSRLVLLNEIAQTELVPILLTPREEDNESSNALFSKNTFRQFLCPKLLEIFKVRDAQIRLLLLENFHCFMHTFNEDELKQHVLPELLVGIKDTNDELVSATLKALAELVSILGAKVVIGGKRARLFNDGRPMPNYKKRQGILNKNHVNPGTSTGAYTGNLPERPRPDGGEEVDSTEENDGEDLENWDDWEGNEAEDDVKVDVEKNEVLVSKSENLLQITKKPLPNIQSLDIKTKVGSDENEDVNFFQDMEPVITQPNKFVIEENSEKASDMHMKFTVTTETEEDGWENNEGWE